MQIKSISRNFNSNVANEAMKKDSDNSDEDTSDEEKQVTL